jgi:hypothetical protein
LSSANSICYFVGRRSILLSFSHLGMIKSRARHCLLWTRWPDWTIFRPTGDNFLWAVFRKLQKWPTFSCYLFPKLLIMCQFWQKNTVGLQFGRIFTNSSGYPGSKRHLHRILGVSLYRTSVSSSILHRCIHWHTTSLLKTLMNYLFLLPIIYESTDPWLSESDMWPHLINYFCF